MKQGAVAVIDALGFRKVLNRCSAEELLKNMRELKDL